MHEVFISFETGTAGDLAEHVQRVLDNNNISAFMYSTDICPGDEDALKIIINAIKECKYFIVLITAYNLGKAKEEIKLARQLKKTVLAYKFKDSQIKQEEITKIIPELNSLWTGEDFTCKEELARKVLGDLGRNDPDMLEKMLEKKELDEPRNLEKMFHEKKEPEVLLEADLNIL